MNRHSRSKEYIKPVRGKGWAGLLGLLQQSALTAFEFLEYVECNFDSNIIDKLVLRLVDHYVHYLDQRHSLFFLLLLVYFTYFSRNLSKFLISPTQVYEYLKTA